MIFNKALGLATAFAALASAIPHPPHRARGGSTPSVSPTSSASPSSSGGAGGGGVQIKNNLDQNVYLWSVGSTADNEMHTLSPNGGTYSENWQTPSGGGGVSIKLATKPDQSDVLQYEYTVGGDLIYWDLSVINMGQDSEFTKYGFAVEPSQPGGNCPSAVCKAGDTACSDAYLFPTDDHATHGCPIDTAFTLEIGQ
ncbi:thaumatin domain protein [Aspergillus sclerotialis]|uniref:Thaumatin domain protein n=1 Tax=Aspergillus sclerotialis TaxID=2070753 RepID=A0A3A2ZCM5_9EURO|nr:thaumatin domain protein [Aspergillus sclerotialis]